MKNIWLDNQRSTAQDRYLAEKLCVMFINKCVEVENVLKESEKFLQNNQTITACHNIVYYCEITINKNWRYMILKTKINFCLAKVR